MARYPGGPRPHLSSAIASAMIATSKVPAADAERWLAQLIALTRDIHGTRPRDGAGCRPDGRPGALSRLACPRRRARLMLGTSIDADALTPAHKVATASSAETNRTFGEPLPHGVAAGQRARVNDDSGARARSRSGCPRFTDIVTDRCLDQMPSGAELNGEMPDVVV